MCSWIEYSSLASDTARVLGTGMSASRPSWPRSVLARRASWRRLGSSIRMPRSASGACKAMKASSSASTVGTITSSPPTRSWM